MGEGKVTDIKQKVIKTYRLWLTILIISGIFFAFAIMDIWKLSIDKHNTQPLERPVFNEIEIVDFFVKEPHSATNMSKQELIYDNDIVQEYMLLDGKKHLILRPYVLMDIETGEEIDLRIGARAKSDPVSDNVDRAR